MPALVQLLNGRFSMRVLLTAVCLLSATSVVAQDLVAKSGQELYERYCASCHGVGGRGDGPVAKSLRVEVPDLTRFASRHGGAFDRDRAERIIDGRFVIAAHGSRTMPIWGESFSRAGIGDPNAEQATRIVVARLADYLSQLQQPSQKTAPR